MEHIQVEEFPRLRDPIFILAFEGWNDAAQSATIAARFLVNRLDGKRFAWFQSDDFYQYSDQRPQVRLDTEGNRQITWPENAFFYCQHPDLSRGSKSGKNRSPRVHSSRLRTRPAMYSQ